MKKPNPKTQPQNKRQPISEGKNKPPKYETKPSPPVKPPPKGKINK